ncbi:MAG: acyl-CoA dehydratase activase-related protein [Desulfosalsimonas sp.]
MKIGIPRAFYYHSYPGLWESFFRRLGCEPVISSRSTQKTLETAAQWTEPENCLPQKLFDGHALSLMDSVDALFVPRIHSMVKAHNCCPRFGALLDATRAGIARGMPLVSIDINETAMPLSKALYRLARHTFGVRRKTARLAVEEAFSVMHRQLAEEAEKEQKYCGQPKLLLLGHPYTLHDHFIAEPVIGKLEQLRMPLERITFGDDNIAAGDILWCVFNKMHRKLQRIDTRAYAGVIQITTFNCGADSMMTDRFRRICRRKGLPYMLLMVDEHTEKTGLDTRLEAFADSLSWQQTETAK